MLDKKTVINAVHKYSDIVTKEFSPNAIVLYGSYARGNAHEDSDIDVAVIFDNFKGNWLKTSNRLWRLTENINLYIEPILLDATEDKNGFIQYIYKTGRIIYSKNI